MAHIPTDDEMRDALRKLKGYVGLREIATASGAISYRTLYRQSGKKPPDMDVTTRNAITDLLDELGLLGSYDLAALRQAARMVERRATSAAADAAEKAARAAGETEPPKGGRRKRGGE